ncbi:hypothetical protein LTR17_012534 [Elasticomyces elasticus]|nr:hypothetical protein LTR17_012534 [Elasticomyces elasticus]
MADLDDYPSSTSGDDGAEQDPVILAEDWDGDDEDLEALEHSVRAKMSGPNADKPTALAMCHAILRCQQAEAFHRARFNFYVSLLDDEEAEMRLELAMSWLKDAEESAPSSQQKYVRQFKQNMVAAKRALVPIDNPGISCDFFVSIVLHLTHTVIEPTQAYPQPPTHPRAPSPGLGLDGIDEREASHSLGLDGAHEHGHDHEHDHEHGHEPSAAETAAKEKLAADVEALKEGVAKKKKVVNSMRRLPKSAKLRLANQSFASGKGSVGTVKLALRPHVPKPYAAPTAEEEEEEKGESADMTGGMGEPDEDERSMQFG